MFTEYDWMLEEEDWFHEEYYKRIAKLQPDDGSTNDGNQYCDHVWVNISFNHIRFACRGCGIDKPE